VTTVTITPESAIAEWEAQLAALPEQGDVPQTYNTQADYVRRQSFLTGHIRSARMQLETLAEVEQQIADLEPWLANLQTWRTALSTDLLALPRGDKRAWNYAQGIRVIDRGLGVIANSGHMLETLRLGQLMRDSGYTQSVPPPPGEAMMRLPWLGSLPEVERKLRDLTVRRDDARQALEGLLREPMPSSGRS
jgi:hypothetical protein